VPCRAGRWAYQDNKPGEIQIGRAEDAGERAKQTGDGRSQILDLELFIEEGGRAMMKRTTANKPDVQNDHDPDDIGPKTANKPKGREEKSQLEGPAAYAPHDESEKLNRSTGWPACSMSCAKRFNSRPLLLRC
jgi:hypothetical protein